MNRLLWVCAIVFSGLSSAFSQQLASHAPAESGVPRLVSFGGMLHDPSGAAQAGVAGVTFAIYKDQQGGGPLWMETQNVAVDKTGHYTVQLGSTRSDGLPVDLFASGEARWLGVQVSGQAEQPRVLLLSVPYALKAGDAATVGGLPPSAFVLAAPASGPVSAPGSEATSASSDAASVPPPATITGAGTVNFVPLFTGAATIGNSALFQSGASPTAKIGINTSVPATTLDVKGAGTFRGALTLPATAPATAVAGKTSQPLNLVASSFNSTVGTPVNQTFRLQSEPVGNNTATTSGTLNLLYASGANAAAETGLKIASTGRITFAAGQTFPGTGTVSSVALSAPTTDFTVTGSPVTTSGTVKFAWKFAPTNVDTASAIVKRDANGAFSSGEITATSVGTITAAVKGTNSVSGFGVLGFATGTSGQGVWGESLGTQFSTSNGQGADGVHGQTHTNAGSGVAGLNSDPGGIGVFGQGTGFYTTGSGYGVYGVGATGVYGGADDNTSSHSGTGVYGENGAQSATAASLSNQYPVGLWGDGGTNSGTVPGEGVFGTSDNGNAGYFVNDSPNYFTLTAVNTNSSGYIFAAFNSPNGANCVINNTADLTCSGTVSGTALLDGGTRKVGLSAIQSPKNWFEDAGSAQLASGAAVVRLDSDFAQTVNTEVEYNVFLTPYGDCKGLYVTNRTANSFEVRELGGGTSGISFGYRIMALRKKYENVRFADHTHDSDPSKQVTPRKSPGARVALPARAVVPMNDVQRLHAAQPPKVN